MKNIKSYNEFSVNEEFVSSLGKWISNIRKKAKREAKETKICLEIIIKIVKSEIYKNSEKPTQREIDFAKEHSKDLMKLVPILVFFPTPVPYLEMALILNKFGINILPSDRDLLSNLN
jgi:hypothetical protein